MTQQLPLLDDDPVTTEWPMPEGGPIVLDPKCRSGLTVDVERVRALFRGWQQKIETARIAKQTYIDLFGKGRSQ